MMSFFSPNDNRRAIADENFYRLLRAVTRELAEENRPAAGVSAAGAGDDSDPYEPDVTALGMAGVALRWIGYGVAVGAVVYVVCRMFF